MSSSGFIIQRNNQSAMLLFDFNLLSCVEAYFFQPAAFKPNFRYGRVVVSPAPKLRVNPQPPDFNFCHIIVRQI